MSHPTITAARGHMDHFISEGFDWVRECATDADITVTEVMADAWKVTIEPRGMAVRYIVRAMNIRDGLGVDVEATLAVREPVAGTRIPKLLTRDIEPDADVWETLTEWGVDVDAVQTSELPGEPVSFPPTSARELITTLRGS